MHGRGVHGQSLVEYAVLAAAVIVGVMAVVNLTYQAFVRQATDIEREEVVF